jgi:hypothetical protein
MVLKLGTLLKVVQNYQESFKRGARDGWRRSI